MAFEAAAMGLGIALGRRPLVDRDLASGALVEVGLPAIEAETAIGWSAPMGRSVGPTCSASSAGCCARSRRPGRARPEAGASPPEAAPHRHCERSEAIHGGKSGGMDCFVGFASSQ
jgi:hypothetical protein